MALKRSKILATADKYISQQKFEKALNEYLKLVKLSPNDTNLLNKVGDLYSKTGNPKSAISYFERVAQAYHKGGFYPKAIALYKKINRIDPDYMESKEKLVELYLQQGHHSEAKAELRRMAEFYNKNNLPGRAMDVYQKLVQLDPTNLDARMKLTDVLIQEGKNQEASEHFLKMGNELIDKNLIPQARKILGQASKLAPDNVQIQILLAKAMISEGKVEEAIRFLTDLCERNPNELDAVVTLGDAYISKNMISQAKTCYLRAIHIAPDHTAPLEEVARMLIEKQELDEAYDALLPVNRHLMRQGEAEEATRLFRSILYADDKHLPSLKKLVDIYRESDQIPNAILTLEKIINFVLAKEQPEHVQAYIEQLLELDPDNLEWRSKLEQLTGEEGAVAQETPPAQQAPQERSSLDLTSTDGKRSTLEDVGDDSIFAVEAPEEIDLEPDDPATKIQNHLTEAEVFIKYGIIDQALNHLQEIMELDPNHFEANLKLKQIYVDRKDIDKAVACLTNLATLCIDQDKLDEAEEFLEEAETFKPGVARMYRNHLESLRRAQEAELDEVPGEGDFDLDFASLSDSQSLDGSGDDLVLNKVSPDEVVDFRNIGEEAEDGRSLDLGSLSDSMEKDWSLDIPLISDEAEAPVAEEEEVEPPVAEEEEEAEAVASEDQAANDFDFSEDRSHKLLEDEIEVDALDEGDKLFSEQIDDTEILPDLKSPAGATPPDQSITAEEEDLRLEEPPAEAVKAKKPKPSKDAEDLVSQLLEEAAVALDKKVAAPPVTPDETEAPEEVIPVEEPKLVTEDLPPSTQDLAQDLEELPSNLHSPEEEVSAPDAPEINQEELEAEIEEIDFFLSMDAYKDARNLISEAVAKYGEHPQIVARRDIVDENLAESPAPAREADESLKTTEGERSIIEEGTGFFDLAAELQEELFDEATEITDNASQEEIQSVEELFEEFKRGVSEQIDEDDFETHYDLGIAYKEMGLLEESVQEFRHAQGDPNRFMECTAMIGACLIELGRGEEAIQHFLDSLNKKGASEAAYRTIKYELALAYEGFGEPEKALELFQEIHQQAPTYRDVESRIKALV